MVSSASNDFFSTEACSMAWILKDGQTRVEVKEKRAILLKRQ